MRKIQRILICILMVLSLFPVVHAEEESFQAWFSDPSMQEQLEENSYVFEGKTTVDLQAWRRETVYLKVKVSFADNCTVTAEFDGLYGKKILKDHTLGLLGETEASMGVQKKLAPKVEVSDIITDEKKAEGKKGTAAYFWLSIPVPQDAPAGMYHGTLKLSDGTAIQKLKVNLEVLNLSLEKADFPALNLWQYPYSSYSYYDVLKGKEPYGPKHLEILKKEMELYHNLGGESITCTISEEPWAHQTFCDTPSQVVWKLDENNNLFFDYTAFDAWVQLCMDLGIDERIDCFSILPFDNTITLYRADGSKARLQLHTGDEEWTYYWTGFLKAFVAHLEEKGWFEKTYLFLDEAETEDYQTVLNLVHSIISSQGKTMMLSSAVNTVPRDEKLFDDIEYLSISISAFDPQDQKLVDFIEHRREKGLQTALYNCSGNYPNSFLISDPVESVWFQMYAMGNNFDGYLRWAYNAWNADPLMNADYPAFEAGDPWLIYPDEKSAEHPIPRMSVRLCMISRGRQDCAKAAQLERLLKTEGKEVQDALQTMKQPDSVMNRWGAVVAKDDAARCSIHSQVMELEDLLDRDAALLSKRVSGNRFGRRLMKLD